MSAQPTIVVDGVSKWFSGVVAVSGVSLVVEPGITALRAKTLNDEAIFMAKHGHQPRFTYITSALLYPINGI